MIVGFLPQFGFCAVRALRRSGPAPFGLCAVRALRSLVPRRSRPARLGSAPSGVAQTPDLFQDLEGMTGVSPNARRFVLVRGASRRSGERSPVVVVENRIEELNAARGKR
jgi:hypothetical protein